MMIAPFNHAQVRQIARLHCASLNGLLTKLGPSAVYAYYAGAVDSNLSSGFVATDGQNLTGFVFGSVTPGALKRDILRRKPLAMPATIGLGIVRHPTVLWWILRSFRGPDEGTYDAASAELTYLAVDPAQRNVGIGRKLVDAFTSALRDAGARSYALSVDEVNHAAIAFYERLGFTRLGRYREFGQCYLRYQLNLISPKAQ